MEKINKEELMKKLNLTEEELEKVAGGTSKEFTDCIAICILYHKLPTTEDCILDCQKLLK